LKRSADQKEKLKKGDSRKVEKAIEEGILARMLTFGWIEVLYVIPDECLNVEIEVLLMEKRNE